MGQYGLEHIRNNWWKIEQKLNAALSIDEKVGDSVNNISFNASTNEITFSYVNIDGDTITNTLNLSSIGGSGAFEINYVVDTFSDLSGLTPDPFEFARVRNSQGTSWLPGSLGGTYYGSGLYMWDGAVWENDNDDIYTLLNKIANDSSKNITNNYTVVDTDSVLLCNGTFQIDLLSASALSRKTLNIKNIGTGQIDIQANGAETIDGSNSITLNIQYGSVTLFSDGTNWHIL